MRILGNIIWIICGGLISAIIWALAGVLWCITIIGIPVGLQCFKLAGLALNPFGKEVVYEGGPVSFIINVIWFLLSGLEIAVTNLALGIILCITIVGIPFGMQFFKFAGLAIRPFGASVRKVHYL